MFKKITAWCSTIGLIGIISTITYWNGWLTPVQQIPRSIEITLLVLPAILLLKGVLTTRHSSLVYTLLVAIVYSTIGVWYAFSPEESAYGWSLVGFSALLYAASFAYLKTLPRPNKQ